MSGDARGPLKEVRDKVLIEALGLSLGCTVRVVCPACNGGAGSEKCMAITRMSDGVAYRCHRASCSVQGRISSSGAVHQAAERKPEVRDEMQDRFATAVRDAVELSYAHDSFLSGLYGTPRGTFQSFGCKYWPAESRVLYPILDHQRNLVGYVARSHNGVRPKSLTLKPAQVACVAFYFPNGVSKNNHLWLVEDTASAVVCASLGYNAAALMGTHVSEAALREIHTAMGYCGYDRVLVALDEDAQAKGNELARSMNLLMDTTFVPLKEDIKDDIYNREAVLAKW